MDNIKIGKTIKELRVNKGLSQADVAKICNITPPAVSKWERGESIPDISSLESLSHLFGVSINEIINSKAEIRIIASKNTLLYKIIISILAFLLVGLIVAGGIYLNDFKEYLSVNNEPESIDNQDATTTAFIEQSNKPYHLYYEATFNQLVQGNISDWIFDMFIQEPELYSYFTEGEHPNLNFVTVNTTEFVRRNNETSTIEILWNNSGDEYNWELDVTYYDITNDDDYENLNSMNHIVSNGNQYEFGVFDDGYFVLYELIDGNTVFDNYYFHLNDMSPNIINEDIRIDYELNNLGIDVIFTDHFQVTRYHFIFPEYDSGYSSWFLNVYNGTYLTFADTGSRKLQFVNFTLENQVKKIFFKGFENDEIVWDYEISIHDYLLHEINIDLIDYTITYQMQNDGLLHITFVSKIDGHIMSYKLLPNMIE